MNGKDVFYEDPMQYAKDLAKAERELRIEHWVEISFIYRKDRKTFHIINLPRQMLNRWMWLIEWRRAKIICQNPRKHIETIYYNYDKRTGLETGFNSLLNRLAARKAQVTRIERLIEAYIKYETENNLFFDACTDERLLKAKRKLEQKKQNYAVLYRQIEQEVKRNRLSKLNN